MAPPTLGAYLRERRIQQGWTVDTVVGHLNFLFRMQGLTGTQTHGDLVRIEDDQEIQGSENLRMLELAYIVTPGSLRTLRQPLSDPLAPQMMNTTDSGTCRKCQGCGRVADTEDQEPWIFWETLPVRSAGAVMTGLIKPIACPDCGGTGKRKEAL